MAPDVTGTQGRVRTLPPTVCWPHFLLLASGLPRVWGMDWEEEAVASDSAKWTHPSSPHTGKDSFVSMSVPTITRVGPDSFCLGGVPRLAQSLCSGG